MSAIKIRRKITSDTLKIKELKHFLGREVDIIVSDRKRVSAKTERLPGEKSTAGILEQYNNPDLLEMEKNIWSLVVSEKHANS